MKYNVWTNQDLIECSQSVMDFLIHCEEEYFQLGTFCTPSNERMSNQLKKFDSHMADFAKELNNTLHILDEPLWVDSPKEFFRDHDKSVSFFKKAINLLTRKNKLECIKNKLRCM